MRYGTWDLLFNLFLLLFWFRMWVEDDRDLFFNPHLAFFGRLTDRIFTFLQPVFFGTPRRIVALCVLAFTLLFRAVLFHGLSAPGYSNWVLKLGVWRWADTANLLPCLAFSVVSFGVMLFNLWGISLLYLSARTGSPSDHTRRALLHLARPFVQVRHEYQPIILLALGCALVGAMAALGRPVAAPAVGLTGLQVDLDVAGASLGLLTARVLLAALAGFVDILGVLAALMFGLIIGSLVSTLAGARTVQFFCRGWISLLLGPLRRHPIVVGTFDLTPLIFLLVIQLLVHPLLSGLIAASAMRLG